jgi:hypothetical protein
MALETVTTLEIESWQRSMTQAASTRTKAMVHARLVAEAFEVEGTPTSSQKSLCAGTCPKTAEDVRQGVRRFPGRTATVDARAVPHRAGREVIVFGSVRDHPRLTSVTRPRVSSEPDSAGNARLRAV